MYIFWTIKLTKAQITNIRNENENITQITIMNTKKFSDFQKGLG